MNNAYSIHTIARKQWFFVILFMIVFIAGFLRFYRIRDIPVSNYWDGVASTYNAYAILKTGKDEYGTFMPILFRSFDDYKMPANIYLTVIPVALFGLNGFSTRFTSALAGTIVTFFIYYLVQELFLLKEKKQFKEETVFFQQRKSIGLLIAFLFAISPWSIQFSRIEFEANVGLMVTIPAIVLFFRAIRQKNLFLFSLSSVLFGVSIYFYRSIVMFIPLLFICFFFIFRKELLVWKKAAILFVILFILLTTPMYISLTGSKGSIRANEVSIFNNLQQQVYTAAKAQQSAGSTYLSKIIYNRRIVYAEAIIQGYISNFSWDFLFTKGDPQGRHSTKGMGMLYLWEFPALLVGFYVLFMKMPRKVLWIVLSWILIAPVPAALSVPTPHALRTLNILPMPELVSGLGISWIFFQLKGIWRVLFSFLVALIIGGFFSYYLFLYYGPNAKVTSSDFGDGYKQLLQYIIPREKQYQKIIISGHYWKPYIYVLFYKQYDPTEYQKSGHWYGFGKYLFGGTRWGKGEYELDYVDLKKFANANNILVALSPDEYAHQKSIIHVTQKIYNHNGDLVFIVGYTL